MVNRSGSEQSLTSDLHYVGRFLWLQAFPCEREGVLERMGERNKGKGAMHTACLSRSLCKFRTFKMEKYFCKCCIALVIWVFSVYLVYASFWVCVGFINSLNSKNSVNCI